MATSVPTPEEPVTDTVQAHPRRWWGLTVLCFAIAILAIDTTVLNFAVPAIAADLDPSATQLLWIIDVYAFVLAALLITMGTLGDRVGRRKVLLIGAALFGVASVLAATAQNPEWLIVGRALQGAAGATLMPSTLSLIRSMFTDARERARAVSVWVSVYAVGAAVGPVLGGYLLGHFHWGSVFLINVPLVAVIIIGGLVTLPASAGKSGAAFDGPGAVLSILALFTLVYVVKVVPVEGIDVRVIACAVVCVVSARLLVRHLRRTETPLIDVELLRNRVYATVVVINGVSMFLYIGVLFYLSQYLQTVLGYTPLAAGLLMFPGLIASVVATLITGRLMVRIPPRPLLVAALILAAVASVIFAADALGMGEHLGGSGLWLAVGFTVLGVGCGMIDPVSNDYILTAAPPRRAGAAASLSETGYELGGAFGTAGLGATVMGVFGHRLAATTDLPEGAGDSLVRAHQLAGGDADLIAAADLAFRHGVVAASVVAALVALLTVIVANRTLRTRD
nr:MFS transporter [Corynebacterium pygosceleis]